MPTDQPLFANRLHAAMFLLGLGAFWSGCLVLFVMEWAGDPHLGRHAQLGLGEAAAILVTTSGALVVSIAQQFLLRRMTGGSRTTMTALVRSILPSTLAEAARTVGLSGPVVACALYGVLLAGVLAFFSSFILR